MKNSRYKKEIVLIFLVLIGISLFLVSYDHGFYTMSMQKTRASAQQYANENNLVLGEMIGIKETFIYVALDQTNPQRSVALLYRKSKYSNTFRKSGVKPLALLSNSQYVLHLEVQNNRYTIEYKGFDVLRVGSEENESQGMDPALLPFLGYLVLVGFLYKKLTNKKQIEA